MKKFQRLIFFTMMIFSSSAFSQSIVSVNHVTGTASASVPMFNVTSGACSFPVSLVYTGSGVRVKQTEGSAGIGWNLAVGGAVTRSVRGLPDDFKADSVSGTLMGWLYNSNSSYVGGFSIANLNAGSCTDESTDRTYMSSHFTGNSDTEPDIFNVSAPGLSCQLVFASDHSIHTIPYMDVKVSYTTSYGYITSFTITNDKGITYVFDNAEASVATAISASPGSIAFYKNYYNQYSGAISYNSSWNLTSINDPDQYFIRMHYSSAYTSRGAQDSVITVINDPSGTTRTKQYYVLSSNQYKILDSISTGHSDDEYKTRVRFTFATTDINTPVVSTVSGYGKTYTLAYVACQASTGFPRWFLAGVGDGGCGTTNYSFQYARTDLGAFSVALPDSASKAIDYWGYYNGSSNTSLTPTIYINPSNSSYERYRFIPPGAASASFPYTISGADRSASTDKVINGALVKITYARGGYTTLKYESNDFYDNTAATVVYGGGIRIKEIADYDGIDTTRKMVRSYAYINPSTSTSSGKPVTLPAFAFTQSYTSSGTTAQKWDYSTVRSDDDQSQEDHTIMYSYVRETRSGAGSTLYEFNVPQTSWDAPSAGWAPTFSNMARSTCSSYGFITGDKSTYPFAPNPNYDYERGLPKKVTTFNDSGTEVSESAYTYTLAASPYTITGFRMEDVSGVTAYAKYLINAGTNELLTQRDDKIYDSPALSAAKQTTINYSYNSPYQNLTQVQTTNSDGSIAYLNTKYIKDYNVSTHSDANTTALYHLQHLNVNGPVETYNRVQRGGTTLTFSGSLMKFSTFTNSSYGDNYKPAQQLAFNNPSGVSGFSASTISSGVMTYNGAYLPVANYLTYDYWAALTSTDNNYKRVSTVLTDHVTHLPIAVFSNAQASEVACTTFDNNITTLDLGFTRTGTPTYSTNSRTGSRSLALASSDLIQKTLHKSAQATSYVFSIWINSTSAGSLSFTMADAGGATQSYSMSFDNTGSTWKYYEKKLPLTSMTSSTFAIKFTSNQNILVDDILAYPDNAEASTIAYDDLTLLKTAETNTNGISNYYKYDELGRLQMVYNQDQFLVMKKTYVLPGQLGSITGPSFLYDPGSSINTSTPVTFYGGGAYYPSCIAGGLTYTWHFGDGSSDVVTTSAATTPVHTFSSTGTYTVRLTVSSPLGSASTTADITVSEVPCPTCP